MLEAPSPETALAPSAPAAPTVIPFNERPKPLVYVGASAYEWKAECAFVDSIVKSMASCHSTIIRDWGVGDAAIGRKRNFQVWRARTHTKAQFLFFIDSDIVFEPWQFDRIVAHDLPIVGGVYFKKCAKLEPVIEGKLSEEDPITHLMEVKSAGTGFLCIRMDVFEAIIQKYGDSIAYQGDPDQEKRWDFFPFGAVNNSYRSEDWYFCDRARECGFKVYVDCSVQLGHVGKIVFPMVRYMGDEDMVNLLQHKYGYSDEAVRAWLVAAPDPAKFKEKK